MHGVAFVVFLLVAGAAQPQDDVNNPLHVTPQESITFNDQSTSPSTLHHASKNLHSEIMKRAYIVHADQNERELPIAPPPPVSPPVQRSPQGLPDIAPDEFPSEPPKYMPSDIPPPLSPSGRWLHTAVLIGTHMWVYGGVGSYSSALYNDMWLFNYMERSWSELQASFVPPFPVEPTDTTKLNQPPGTALSSNPLLLAKFFRPEDTPPEPPMRMVPPATNANYAKPILQSAEDPFEPVRSPSEDILKQETYSPPPSSGNVFSFLEEATSAPPLFWKNDALSPTLRSPFLAADLWSFNLQTKLWKNVKSSSADIPAPRWLHSAVNVDGSMVVFGGVSYSDIILGDVWVFNPTPSTWVKANPTGTPILPREGHSACMMGKSSMWVFGGISYGQIPFNDLWVYKVDTNTWRLQTVQGRKPPPRWLHTCSVHTVRGRSTMFIFGGVTRNFVPLADLWEFDPTTVKWKLANTARSLPPYPRMMHTAACLKHKLMIFGGIANNIPLEDVWTYDIATSTWQEEHITGPYPFAREGASLVVVLPPAPVYQPMVSNGR